MMSLKPSLLAIGVLIALCLAPSAAATFTLDLQADAIAEPVPMGGSESTTVHIVLTATDTMVCPGGDDLVIELAVGNVQEEDGLEATISPESMTFSFSSGVYGVAEELANSTWVETASFTVQLGDNVTRTIDTHQFTVTGFYDGTQPGDCQAASWSEASDSTAVSVEIEFPEEEMDPENGETDPENGETDPENGDVDPQDSPAPGILILVVVGLLFAHLRRRRQ